MRNNKLKNYVISFSMMTILAMSGWVLNGCSSSSKSEDTTTAATTANSAQADEDSESTAVNVAEFTIDTDMNEDYTDEAYDEASATKLELSETVTITEPGTYILSGTIEDGQIVVNSTESGKVRLILDNVNISCSSGSAINVIDGKTIITLAEDSVNTLSDGTTYTEGLEENACIYSDKDLCINGTGTLNVTGNYKAGIRSNDDLRIVNGTINVTSVGDGIKGKDSVYIKGGTINVTSGTDGIQATNTEAETGYVVITGGTINIAADKDGIKGETVLEIDGGTINVTKSEEALEATYIRINDGDVKLVSSDDGINASNGSGESGQMGFGGHGGMMKNSDTESADSTGSTDSTTTSATPILYINGGNIYVNAGGDGVDSNGEIYITGGTIYVDGPTNDGNGFFDYESVFKVTGGTVIGAGSSGMLELPDSSSTQYMIVAGGFTGEAGTEVTLLDSDGNTVMKYTPSKSFQAIAFSSADIQKGETYSVKCGSTDAGSVEVSDVVSYIGITGGMNGGMGGFRGNKGEMSTGDGTQMPDGEAPTGDRPQMPDGEVPTGDMPQMPGNAEETTSSSSSV